MTYLNFLTFDVLFMSRFITRKYCCLSIIMRFPILQTYDQQMQHDITFIKIIFFRFSSDSSCSLLGSCSKHMNRIKRVFPHPVSPMMITGISHLEQQRVCNKLFSDIEKDVSKGALLDNYMISLCIMLNLEFNLSNFVVRVQFYRWFILGCWLIP